MTLLLIILACAVVLWSAYRAYGRLLARLLRLNDASPTPAHTMRDDVDYAPTSARFLIGQHFSAIAAAGPVVGPILAGVMFGWLPALIWIILGSIFIGGVHDFTSLVASVRHKARSIAEVVREHMSRRSFVLFLLFVWIALVYIITAFTDIVAASFVGEQALDDGTVVTGAGIATSSLLYLALPLAMGLLMRCARMPLWLATLVFVPLVGAAIVAGQHWPIDVSGFSPQVLGMSPTRFWAVALLIYCFIASLVPLWLLLQPRGHLGGYFLYAALGAGVVGVIVGGLTGTLSIEYPAFISVQDRAHAGGIARVGGAEPLVPILFITIACGACSGFHCLIASGTTSKQLRRESDARLIGYGTMLLEAMVAVMSLACVMILSADALKGQAPNPNVIYAKGLASFTGALGISGGYVVAFGLLAFTTFVYDTLDVCTRLGRFIVQELTGLHNALGRWMGTAITVIVPVILLFNTPLDPATGNPMPAWRIFWSLFGASNQLLAALALLGITVWLWRTRRALWIWPVVGGPAAFMYVMSTWALLRFVTRGFTAADGTFALSNAGPVAWVALALIALAVLLLIEAALALARPPKLGRDYSDHVMAAA